MTVIAIGLNHRSAPDSLLGEMALAADLWPKLLVEVCASSYVNEAVVVSTCNRTEVYVHAERFHEGYEDVRDALSVVTGVADQRFVPHLYVHYHDDAVRHLFNVASGLDSVVLGEHEILGQLRTAVEAARAEGSLGPVLDRLFVHGLTTGRRVRAETAIGEHTASLSQAALDLLAESGTSVEGKRVLLVGAGDVGASVATAMVKTSSVELSVTNRTRSRAEALAADLSASVLDFEDLGSAVAAADVIVSATASPHAVIQATDLGADPVTILDLAVPPDTAPELATDARVQLHRLSDLQALANRGVERRKVEAERARDLIVEELDRYRQAISALEVDPLLGAMHRWADGIRDGELDRYRQRLGELDPAQAEAVEALTRAVVAKLLHPPSNELRSAAGSPRGDRLAEAIRELFRLS